MNRPGYDAIVVGAGPNGMAAAIVLARAGLHVLLRDGADEPGGGARTAALTLPGFAHWRLPRGKAHPPLPGKPLRG